MNEGESPGVDPGSGFGGVRHRLQYRLDNLLAKGTSAVLVWLGAVTASAVLLVALVLAVAGVAFTGSTEDSFVEDAWQSLMRTIDPGTMAGDEGWGQRLLALAITIFGILVAGTLIGVIASGVEERLDRMRSGRSVVIETGHIVVLGASERVPVVVDQLVTAFRTRGGRALVLLADRDPTDMIDEIDAVVDDFHGSKLVTRSGDPTRRADLALVRLQTASTVIVLAGPDGDAGVVKTVLAVGAELGGYSALTVVAEVTDAATADKLRQACGPTVAPIQPDQALARTAAFALRQAGLSRVIDELFDFRACDLYVRDEASLLGHRFGDVVGRYARARPIGMMRPDGEVELNPAPDATFSQGDRLVVLAQDAGRLVESPPTSPQGGRHSVAAPSVRSVATHLIVLGWNPFGAQLIENWASSSRPDSTIEVVVDVDRHEAVTATLAQAHLQGRFAVAARVGRLGTDAGGPFVDTVVLLSDHLEDPGDADAQVLLDLKVLRTELGGPSRPRFIFELRDVDSVPLVDLEGTDDYLVSEAIASRFIAQLAEQPERRSVFLDMYDPNGATIRLDDVVALGLVGEFEVGALWAAAYEMGLIAIGWGRAPERGGEFVLNAAAADRVELRPGDRLVAIG